jgi:hypothetical protein|tara:strand:+ start:143 stop:586 length:444 start_codon:yes stop_codon:yes gene_type:complete
MNLKRMSGDTLARRWSEIAPLVEEALIHGSGTVTSYGLFIQCLGAVAQCWVDEDAYGDIQGAAITRFEETEGTRIFAIVTTTHPDWFSKGPEVLEFFEEFAEAEGCAKVNIYGRRGWQRVLSKHGYYEPYTIITKDLGGAPYGRRRK